MDSQTNYSKFSALKNGMKVQIRSLTHGDLEGLVTFLRQTPEHVLQFCKEDLRDRAVVDSWVAPDNNGRFLTLVAFDLATKEPVGSIYLVKGQHAALRTGDIQQVLVAPALQGLGLGSLLLDSLLYLAAKEELHWLKAEVVSELKSVIKAFESRGFRAKTVLADYFTDLQGRMYDVVLMLRPMVEQKTDF